MVGIVGHFIDDYHHNGHHGPIGREIYTEIVATVTTFFSLIWLLPFTFNFLHYPFDGLYSLAWFAAFGALVDWSDHAGCGGAFQWGGLANGSYCGKWKAAEAFSFISACLWLASMLLGVHVFHNLRARSAVVTDGGLVPALTPARERSEID